MSDRTSSLKDRLLNIHKEESVSYRTDCVIASNFHKFLVSELKEFENSTGMKIVAALYCNRINVTYINPCVDIELIFSVDSGQFNIHGKYCTTFHNSEQDVVNYIVDQMSDAVRSYNRSKIRIEPGYVPI